jgi:hypothetical protein
VGDPPGLRNFWSVGGQRQPRRERRSLIDFNKDDIVQKMAGNRKRAFAAVSVSSCLRSGTLLCVTVLHAGTRRTLQLVLVIFRTNNLYK